MLQEINTHWICWCQSRILIQRTQQNCLIFALIMTALLYKRVGNHQSVWCLVGDSELVFRLATVGVFSGNILEILLILPPSGPS